MWKSRLALTLGLLALAAPGWARPARDRGDTSVNSFMKSEPAKNRGVDQNQLKEEVADTQPLLDALARETRRLDKAAKNPLFDSLDKDYGLGSESKEARRLLERQEAALDLEDAVAVERAKLEAAEAGPQRRQIQDRLDNLGRERLARAKDLLQVLMEQHKHLKEAGARDYRTWMMVWEGRLRQKREEAEASKPKASPEALSAGSSAPPAAAKVPDPKPKKAKASKSRPAASRALSPAAATAVPAKP